MVRCQSRSVRSRSASTSTAYPLRGETAPIASNCTGAPVPAARGGRLGARFGDGDAVRRHAELAGQKAGRARAAGDHPLSGGQRRSFGGEELAAAALVAARLEGEGMVDEGDNAPAELADQPRRHGSVGEPVDEKDRAGRGCPQPAVRFRKIVVGRVRVGGRQRDMADADAMRRQTCEQAPRIGVAAGRRRQVAGNREGDLKHPRARPRTRRAPHGIRAG